MGQRTQIIVQRLQDFEDSNKVVSSKVITDIYHNQWGYGVFMLRDVVNIINEGGGHYQRWVMNYNREQNDASQNTSSHSEYFGKAFNINSDYNYSIHTDKVPLITSVNQFQEMVKSMDNNNGWCLLRLKCDKFGYIESGQYYFFKGTEECWNNQSQTYMETEASRIVSAKEYIDCCYGMDITQWEIDSEGKLIKPQANNNYLDAKKYLNIFREVSRYYNVKPGRLMGNKVLKKNKDDRVIAPAQEPIDIKPTI